MKTGCLGDGDSTGMKLDARDARRDVVVTDGLGNWSDVSREHRDMPDI